MNYEQIWKKFFPLEINTYVKELITSEGDHFLILFYIIITIINLFKCLV